jgi:predicted metalloprotease with PDZ domain
MEHATSTAITLPAKTLSDNFAEFENVTAHEFFHLWNVKRIRPQSLEPIDYTRENYTRALWFSEGVDSTAAELILLRAGLLDEKRYLEHLSRSITELESRPAHLTQSAEESSLDVWLEKYPYYGLPARSISYYNKGELLGVLLDLEMREATNDETSLGTLFRWMNQHEAKQGRSFADSAGVRQAAEALTHRDFAEFFERYVAGVDEIPWNRFFARVGLELERREAEVADPGFEAVGKFDQAPEVVAVDIGSPAERAGLKVEDVILEFNGQPAGRNLRTRLEELRPGTILRLSILRDRHQVELEWTLGRRKQPFLVLEDRSTPNPEERERRARWLFDQAPTR